MNSERKITVNGSKIEEYYWNGKYVVYYNDKLVHNNYEEEIIKAEELHAKQTNQ